MCRPIVGFLFKLNGIPRTLSFSKMFNVEPCYQIVLKHCYYFTKATFYNFIHSSVTDAERSYKCSKPFQSSLGYIFNLCIGPISCDAFVNAL